VTAALDTNVLAYAEGVNDSERQAKAIDLIAALPSDRIVIPVQVLGELFRVLTGKAGRSPHDARMAVLSWRDTAVLRETSTGALMSALDLAADHGLTIWDALILAVAADAGCRMLLTEDLQPGFVWRGVTVVDPFARDRHPLLGALLEPATRR